MGSRSEVTSYVVERGGVVRFSLCQRGRELLVFVEVAFSEDLTTAR